MIKQWIMLDGQYVLLSQLLGSTTAFQNCKLQTYNFYSTDGLMVLSIMNPSCPFFFFLKP